MLEGLEFEGGRLVKVHGMRPEYMSGYDLSTLVRLLGAEVHRLRDQVSELESWQESAFRAHPNIDLDIEKLEGCHGQMETTLGRQDVQHRRSGRA